jgi:hypothetical protein
VSLIPLIQSLVKLTSFIQVNDTGANSPKERNAMDPVAGPSVPINRYVHDGREGRVPAAAGEDR